MAISKKSTVIWVHCRNFWSAPTTQTLAGHALLKIFQPEFSALRISMYFLWFVQSIFSGWLEPRSPIMARQKGDLANFNLNVCSGSKTKIQVLLPLCMSRLSWLCFYLQATLLLHGLLQLFRGGSRISKGGVDGRPYLLRGGRENALTKKIGNNFSCTCLRRVF